MSESPKPNAPQLRGTLRLSREAQNGNWDTWTLRVKEEMARNNFERAAHTLACCMVGPDSDQAEVENARPMFMLPELVPHHQQLWDLIVKDNELGFDDGVQQRWRRWEDREKIANFLFDEFAWKIE